jgi:hypothetical protein
MRSLKYLTPANPAGAKDTIYLAPSGKSPAYLHHRKNFLKARAGEPAAGFFIRIS